MWLWGTSGKKKDGPAQRFLRSCTIHLSTPVSVQTQAWRQFGESFITAWHCRWHCHHFFTIIWVKICATQHTDVLDITLLFWLSKLKLEPYFTESVIFWSCSGFSSQDDLKRKMLWTMNTLNIRWLCGGKIPSHVFHMITSSPWVTVIKKKSFLHSCNTRFTPPHRAHRSVCESVSHSHCWTSPVPRHRSAWSLMKLLCGGWP